MKLSELVKDKVPYVIQKRGKIKYLFIISKHGFETYRYGGDPQGLVSVKPLNEITSEDLQLFLEKVPGFKDMNIELEAV